MKSALVPSCTREGQFCLHCQCPHPFQALSILLANITLISLCWLPCYKPVIYTSVWFVRELETLEIAPLSLSLPVETKAQVAQMTDTVKHRLEQLDDMEEGSIKETLNLNMKDYIHKIDTMNQALTSAWQRDQRVMALKIAIQVRKSG